MPNAAEVLVTAPSADRELGVIAESATPKSVTSPSIREGVGVIVSGLAVAGLTTAPGDAATDGVTVVPNAVASLIAEDVASTVGLVVMLAVTGECVRVGTATEVGEVPVDVAPVDLLTTPRAAVVVGVTVVSAVAVSTIAAGIAAAVGLIVTPIAPTDFVMKPELAAEAGLIVTSAVA
jgi:hypothetical protein